MTGPTIGDTADSFEVVIERGKVREFATATQACDASWHADPSPVIPPTFLTADRFWATPDSSALGSASMNWARILHGEQEYVFHGPPPTAGMQLTAQQRVADRYLKDGKRGGSMTFTVVVTEYRDHTGALVAEGRATVIETSQAATL